jgi:hypothetical protein
MTKEVGYGRPPKSSRFKPGQSGNPSGRRRGTPNVRAELEAELNELMPLGGADQQEKVSKIRFLVKSIVTAALTGNLTAAKLIFERLDKSEPPEAKRTAERLSSTDQELLKKFNDAQEERQSSPPDRKE